MRFVPLVLASCAALALSGCAETREALDLNAAPPDEFAVVDHPPLTMPPDFTLRPPRPGEVSTTQNILPAKTAAQALYGQDKMEAVPGQGVSSLGQEKISPVEKALVSNAGAVEADPKIRSTLDRESTEVVANRRLIDALLLRDPKAPPATTVDPIAERKRLEEAKEKNLPVTSGATPVMGGSKDSPTSVQ
jgi:hypothetical protein